MNRGCCVCHYVIGLYVTDTVSSLPYHTSLILSQTTHSTTILSTSLIYSNGEVRTAIRPVSVNAA